MKEKVLIFVLSCFLIGSKSEKGHDISCDGGKMKARFSDEYIRNMTKYTPEKLMMINGKSFKTSNSCIWERKEKDIWEVKSNLKDCVYKSYENEESQVYEFLVLLKIDLGGRTPVSHERPTSIRFSCVYKKLEEIHSLNIGLISRDISTQILTQGDYSASIKVYKDKNYLKSISNIKKPLKMSDRIYVKVETAASGVILKIKKCSLSNRSDPQLSIALIEEGCPSIPSIVSHPQSTKSRSTFNFASSLLVGAEDSLISSNLVQCHVSFCDFNIRKDCYDLPHCGELQQI